MVFFSVSGTSILFLVASDFISGITETACQSTVMKAFFFFHFSLCTVQVGIFDFIYHLQIAVGIPESQFGFTNLMNEKKILLVLYLLFVGFESCTPGTLAHWASLMTRCHSTTVKRLRFLLTLKELVHQNT